MIKKYSNACERYGLKTVLFMFDQTNAEAELEFGYKKEEHYLKLFQ